MKLTLAQLNPKIGDFQGNLEKIKSAFSQAVNDDADLLIFPELFLTGYPPRDLLERQDFIKASNSALDSVIGLTQNFADIAIILGTIRLKQSDHANTLYNSAVVIQSGEVIFEQAKTLLPTYDVFDEDRYFKSSRNSSIFKYKESTIGLTICEDAWNDPELRMVTPYPVNPVEKIAALGAELCINLSASPFSLNKERKRHQLMQRHATRHHMTCVLVNQVGGQDELIFDGNSFVTNAKGEITHQLHGFQEQIITVLLDETKPVQIPVSNIEQSAYDALVLGLTDYLGKCGFKRVVLGLSGGIDSTLVACIAADAIGPENVLGIAMPSIYSSEGSVSDAQTLAKNLKLQFKIVPIKKTFDSYKNMLSEHFKGKPEDVTEENIQARIRGNILMAFSNKFGAMTLATGNKSELSVGYCTMYGDMSGGLSVIGDVPKMLVYRLCLYINRKKEIIPENILTKPPSAELRPDQKDEDSLPPYEILDAVVELYVDQMKSFQEIVDSGYDAETVRWIIRTISRNEYKRRQAAPVLRITSKAYGTGRRMPIAASYCFASEDDK